MPRWQEQVEADTDGTSILGKSTRWQGVLGIVENPVSNGGPAGVYGLAKSACGVVGESNTWIGVYGIIEGATTNYAPAGVFGLADKGSGVIGVSKKWVGVYGEAHGETPGGGPNRNWGSGVWGKGAGEVAGVIGDSEKGVGIWGRAPIAGRFQGDVEVTGIIRLPKTGDIQLANGDGAEEFDIAEAEAVEPGTVMVLGDEGVLYTSSQPYDKRVAGIVSGAGTYRPALVLDRQENSANRLPIALFGKVFCKVDATYGTVAIGDLLTTSPTLGHAMKAQDPLSAFGAVIGKALRPLGDGQGLIPVLVSLQ
jgi:hypothetical protein